VSRRAVAAALSALCLVVSGCHSKAKPAPSAGKPSASLVVTRDLGSERLLHAAVAPGQTVMAALGGVAKVSTRYGGRYVQSLNGLSGSLRKADDWTFFVNGLEARVGATGVTLHAGDRVWWDFRPWADLPTVPAVVGSFPEPFVHGTGRPQAAVEVRGSDALARALRRDGAKVTGASSRWRVLVGGDAALRADAQYRRAVADPLRAGIVVSMRAGTVVGFTGHGGLQPVPGARAAVFAVRSDGGATLYVAGTTPAAARAAAAAIARRPSLLADRYAVALGAGADALPAGAP
jgi:uncharacterized protein DUF4430